MTRASVRAAMVAGVLGGLVVAGCTGETSRDADPTASSPPPTATTPAITQTSTPTATAEPVLQADGLVVLAAGAEPRTRLSVGDDVAAVAVTATSMTTTVVDGATTTSDTSADYRLEVALETTGDTHVMTATPELLGVDIPGPTPSVLGSWVWTLDAAGGVLDTEARDWTASVHPDLRDLLTFTHLVLEVPDQAVGPGARWVRDLDGPGSEAGQVEVVLDEVGDQTVTATITASADASDGRQEATTAGTWDATTLAAVDVTTTSDESGSGEVVVDGVATTMDVARVGVRHLLREES